MVDRLVMMVVPVLVVRVQLVIVVARSEGGEDGVVKDMVVVVMARVYMAMVMATVYMVMVMVTVCLVVMVMVMVRVNRRPEHTCSSLAIYPLRTPHWVSAMPALCLARSISMPNTWAGVAMANKVATLPLPVGEVE